MSHNDSSSHPIRQQTADLRARREALGLTRADVARDAGCSITALQNLEAGVTRRGITKDRVTRLLTRLETTSQEEADAA